MRNREGHAFPPGPKAASPTRGPDDGDPKGTSYIVKRTSYIVKRTSRIVKSSACRRSHRPLREDHAKPGRRRLPSGPRGRLPHPEGNTTADRPDRNEDMMSGARQRAARAGVSQGPARPTRDDHRPAVHTTGLRTPASSTRPAQRHGPDGPPSCVRQIGTTHKDGEPSDHRKEKTMDDRKNIECDDCGRTLCGDCRHECGDCHATLCGDCRYGCVDCGGGICEDCIRHCADCDEPVCGDCYAVCENCDEYLCQG